MAYGIDGVLDEVLHPLEFDHTTEVLTRLLPEVTADAETEIRRLLELASGKSDVRVWFNAIRTVTQPYMIGVDVNRRYWSKHGDLYSCVHLGSVKAGKLEMVSTGQEDAVWIWLCLAAG